MNKRQPRASARQRGHPNKKEKSDPTEIYQVFDEGGLEINQGGH